MFAAPSGIATPRPLPQLLRRGAQPARRSSRTPSSATAPPAPRCSPTPATSSSGRSDGTPRRCAAPRAPRSPGALVPTGRSSDQSPPVGDDVPAVLHLGRVVRHARHLPRYHARVRRDADRARVRQPRRSRRWSRRSSSGWWPTGSSPTERILAAAPPRGRGAAPVLRLDSRRRSARSIPC